VTGDPEAWQTDAPGPFLTIRAGGPLDGVVTIAAVAEGHGRSLVGASWTQDGHTHSDSVEVETYEHARELAGSIAKELADGTPPDLTRD
jgi:hypothetical protein